MMSSVLNSYLRYARGEAPAFSPWALLNVFGLIVRPFTRMRNAFYDRGIFHRTDPPIPVISIGNLCHGGTNKTPMVELFARTLMRSGLLVGIVSRGYSGETKSPLWIGQDARSSDRSITGDEPLMLARRLPEVKVVVSRDRYEGVCLLAELGVDVAVADDAFQHRRMGRDLDIVLIDATCPFGNGRLFPAGILREQQEALSRADMVILTKVEQASGESIRSTKKELAKWISPACIFTARVRLESWLVVKGKEVGDFYAKPGEDVPRGTYFAFSAIGNPDSFYRSLAAFGIDVVEYRSYRDHHRFTRNDIGNMERRLLETGADGFVCTEKDLHNMPEDPGMSLPLYIPRIAVSIDDEARFFRLATNLLRPELIVASNGYGEDAIGALLAARMAKRFPLANVSAFSLVGSGKEYRDRGVDVISPPSEMPSAGVVKYSLKALLRDFNHGLRKDIAKQIETWRGCGGRYRTPICVGDAYLLAHTLWGQGLTPVLIAAAKSVHLNGHWGVERGFLRSRSLKVWTRDEQTAEELKHSGVDAVFCGNPIMDLALERADGEDPWKGLERPHVMLLPGSRPRAYDDIALLLEAVERLNEKLACSYVMVLAPTIDKHRLVSSVPYILDDGEWLVVGKARVSFYSGPLASVAQGADLLIGLGGTANQVSAGLGVPVLSILERGKLVQKKLLKGAEVLVPPTADSLAAAAAGLLQDPVRRNRMAEEGIKILGGPGAIDSVIDYAARELGWDARSKLYGVLRSAWCPEEKHTGHTLKTAKHVTKEVETIGLH